MEKRYLTNREMCRLYGVSHNTIKKYFDYAVIHIGRAVRYDLREIERGGMEWSKLRAEVGAQPKPSVKRISSVS